MNKKRPSRTFFLFWWIVFFGLGVNAFLHIMWMYVQHPILSMYSLAIVLLHVGGWFFISKRILHVVGWGILGITGIHGMLGLLFVFSAVTALPIPDFVYDVIVYYLDLIR